MVGHLLAPAPLIGRNDFLNIFWSFIWIVIFLLLLFDPKSIALHNSLNIVEIQGNLLDKPHTDLDSHYFASSTGLHVGVSSMQGWRPSMEDAHVFVDIPSRRDHLFLAVFDG